MRPNDLLELLRLQSFQPFRICTTDNRNYDIRHPDQLIITRSKVVIGVGGKNGVAEQIEHVSLLHVVRVEELASQSREST